MFKGGENLKVWYTGGKAYIDIDDAVEVVVGSVGDRELEIYKTNRDDWEAMIYKETRVDLMHMQEGDLRDFMDLMITVRNLSIGF
jgi:hypothetical protein